MTNAPAVSVIIPLYNAEKYIGECLDSILAQTFHDFEVIVVDDCSTDSSYSVVESYREKFGGRLKLFHMDTNSGTPGAPRNKGLVLSRGEYIFFADADDMLAKNALEESYTLAKDFDTDVIYRSRYYIISENNKIKTIKNAPIYYDKLVLDENLQGRVRDIIQNKYWLGPWRSFVKRTFLIEHEIFFPHVRVAEDVIWSYGVFFNAKRFLHAPNPVYFYRQTEGSMMRDERVPKDAVNFWSNPLILGLKAIDNFMSKIEFFKKNPQYRYAVIEYFMLNRGFNRVFKPAWQMSPVTFYEIIKQEFGDKLGEQDVLIAALCTIINTQQKNFAVNNQKFQHFAAQAQARIAQLEAQLKTK